MNFIQYYILKYALKCVILKTQKGTGDTNEKVNWFTQRQSKKQKSKEKGQKFKINKRVITK